MDKASAYGAEDCRFESCRGHCAAGQAALDGNKMYSREQQLLFEATDGVWGRPRARALTGHPWHSALEAKQTRCLRRAWLPAGVMARVLGGQGLLARRARSCRRQGGKRAAGYFKKFLAHFGVKFSGPMGVGRGCRFFGLPVRSKGDLLRRRFFLNFRVLCLGPFLAIFWGVDFGLFWCRLGLSFSGAVAPFQKGFASPAIFF